MNPEETAQLEKLFTRYGSPSKEAEIRIHHYCTRPDQIDTLDRITWQDRAAAETLKALDAASAQLRAYRAALFERYNQIATAPTIPVVKLLREKHWKDSKVYYHLIVTRRDPATGHETETARTTYPGTKRREALAAFAEYVKAHPGIHAEKDIAKKSWE